VFVSELRSIVDRIFEAFNARDFEVYRELLDEHVELVMSGIAVRGLAGVTDFVSLRAGARPGLRVEPERVFVEAGDTLVTEVRLVDAGSGDSADGAGGFETRACDLFRIADGRIVEWRVYADPAAEDLASTALMAVAAEQTALRRVAELVARQAPPEQVFARVTEELSHLLDVNLVRTVRFEPDGSVTVLASRGSAEDKLAPGTNVPLPSGTVIDQVFRTGRPAHVEDYSQVPGPVGDVLRHEGARSGAGGPIVVDERLWGAMAVGSTTRTLAPGTEDRVARFAELVSTAISNIESRTKVERLAAEQSALGRVAEMVARQTPSDQVFAVVTEELSQLLHVSMVRTLQFEPDGSVTVLAAHGITDDRIPPGTNVPIPEGSVIEKVFRTRHPARLDDYSKVRGPIGAVLREQGARSGVAGPIVVDGRLWGAMVVAAQSAQALPPGIEDRVTQFAELVSTAISNIESRAKVERLAAEQSALRRVATLVARAPASGRFFSTVAREVASVLNVPGVIVQRYEADGTVVTVGEAFYSDLAGAKRFFAVGSRMPPDPGSLAAQVFETHRPARIDDFSTLPGTIGDLARAAGLGSGCAGPIVVNGDLWGKMCVFSRAGTVLAVGTENRLGDFIELIATAIANYESRADLATSEARARELAEEQAALRRVATLVAEGATPNRVFDAVRDEVEQMFGIPNTILMRFDPDGMTTLLATPGDYLGPVGRQWRLEGDDSAVARVYRTGRAARADYTAGALGPLAEAARLGGTLFPVAVPVVVDGALWGAMSVGSRGPQPPQPGLEGRLAKFTELLATAIANAESRADLAASEARARELASEQSALRRVAELVARQVPPEQVFAAVTDELTNLFGVDQVGTVRFEPDGSATMLATSAAAAGNRLSPGTNYPLPSGTVIEQVFRTGQPARIEGYAQAGGPIGDVLRKEGVRSRVGGPIVVHGRLWGAMAVGTSGETLPPGTEDRVVRFAELVSAAISNVESRAKVERLAAEQSALRRVATLVAREHSPDDLFATLAEEVGVLLGADAASILRYEADASATVVAGWSDGTVTLPLGERLPLEGENLSTEVLRTGVPQRRTDYGGAAGRIAAIVRELGIRSAVASPIIVEGSTWGVISVLSRQQEPLPQDTEARLAEFSRVASIAVANAKNRSDLADSRARIVRAGDEARRRFERDLHDGAQQRLVSLGLELRAAEATMPPGVGDLRRVLSRLGTGLTDVLDDLRELSRGLHPAVLSEDGLSPALQSLALRSAIPVDLRIDLDPERFEEPVEVAAYYVASEALTNIAKHSHASRAQVSVCERNGWLELIVSDDGRGGADASIGSGLTGLVDRVEAIGGTIQIASTPGAGTTINVKLPARRPSDDRLTTTPR
jgi:GAF domain-containing protein/ketosteroid isomerase-like protein